MAIKSFKQFLMESVRSYHYKIKIAGTPDKNWLDLFIYNLQKFDPLSISDPRSTPIQSDPYGFPGLRDQAITIIDVEFKYPATEPAIRQLANQLRYDENLVRMIQADFDDSINDETKQYANQTDAQPLLMSDYTDDEAARQASKEYGNQYLQSIEKQTEDDKIEMPFAAKKTATVYNPYKPQQVKSSSPMSSINRPDRPATGATSRK